MSESGSRAGDVLAGPRGRELCAYLGTGMTVVEIEHRLVPWSADGLPGAGPADPLATASLFRQQFRALEPGLGDQLGAVAALAEVSEGASYWGEPPPAVPLDHSAVVAELHAVAVRLAESGGCQWWWSPLDRSGQRYVQWTARRGLAPAFGTAAEVLRSAAKQADEQEERRMGDDRHKPAGSGMRGPWWSHPFPGPISTTRRLGRLGAVLLAGQEDGFGDREAVVWPLAVAGSARVFEIDGPEAWQRLVATYPRTATGTYRHTWAWTGWDGEWLMPRWTAVADDWDGVHLSVAGYLATAGRAMAVGTARTLLAGWNPDETYWLTDVLTPDGQAQAWRNDSGAPLGWKARGDIR
ncbi:MAG TPA: hypothetical protein VI365_26525 [Trebonia sp.]